jgi:hypothetical protein
MEHYHDRFDTAKLTLPQLAEWDWLKSNYLPGGIKLSTTVEINKQTGYITREYSGPHISFENSVTEPVTRVDQYGRTIVIGQTTTAVRQFTRIESIEDDLCEPVNMAEWWYMQKCRRVLEHIMHPPRKYVAGHMFGPDRFNRFDPEPNFVPIAGSIQFIGRADMCTIPRNLKHVKASTWNLLIKLGHYK